MSPSSRAAIRFVIALFLAQTFVNAVAVPHPHIHKVLDPREVVSLPVVERQEPAPESKNVFDAIIDTLKGYNGWQVFQDFFRKLFSGESPSDNGTTPPVITVPTIALPTPAASETPIDVISAIVSIISEAVTATDSFSVALPSPTDAEESDGIMSILPIFPITTAIELFPTEEPSIPTELLSETSLAPEVTDIPVVVVPPVNTTDIIEPSDVPIVVVIPPVEANATGIAGPTVPVVVVVPTGIVSPVEANASVSAGVGVGVNVTIPSGTAPIIDIFPTDELNSTAVAGPTAPIVIVVPTVDVNASGIALPTGIVGTAPIVTGPIIIGPIATETPLFPIDNATSVIPFPGTEIPVIIPTGISSPIEANASVSAGVNASISLGVNATISLTTTVGVTVTLEPVGTGVSVGTGLPITLTEIGPFANASTIAPTLPLVTGTGVEIGTIGTIVPTISVEPIDAPYGNGTSVVAPIGTGIAIIGTGILPSNGTAVVSIEPIETIPLGTGIIGTGIIGTGIDEATAALPIGTDLPTFPNTTAIEVVVEPTIILGTGTAPAVGTISAAPIVSAVTGGLYGNTTTITVTNIITPPGFPILTTGIDTAVAPAGTIIIIPGPDNEAVLPNTTITVNAGADATVLPVEITDASILPLPVNATAVPSILPAPVNVTELPIVTEAPSILPAPVSLNISDLAPIAPVTAEFPAIPIETVTAVGPIIDEPIPSDAPVVEFPGEPIIPTLPTPAEETPVASPVDTATPIVLPPIIPIESLVPVESPTTTIAIPVPALTLEAPSLPAVPASASAAADVSILPVVPVLPVAVSASVAASVSAAAAATPAVPVVPVVPAIPAIPAIPSIPAIPAIPAVPAVPSPPRIPTFPLPAPVASVAAAVASAVRPALAPLGPGVRIPPTQ
ncbi:hypothetical protein E8E13_009577 [Curvularia kusanoi]|uniref:Uncharacterized protein n=1 Tax=Curvularia kusanoi TaxID=90978 RepID=A0A9P4W6U9_CURKU|nr:hypothetical protein E8E13_009577 [Curvularia kusanoi]